MSATLEELEELERAGALRGRPALQRRLAELRGAGAFERELAEARRHVAPPVATGPRELVLPQDPAEIGAEAVGLLCLGLDAYRPPIWLVEGEPVRVLWPHRLCFAPVAFVDFLREEAATRIEWLARAFRGDDGQLLAVFEPRELEGNLLTLIARAFGARQRSDAYVAQVWRQLTAEAGVPRLRAWYLAAARDGDLSQMKLLRSKLFDLAAPGREELWAEGERLRQRSGRALRVSLEASAGAETGPEAA